MPGTRDNLLDLLQILKSQGMNYVLAIFEENKNSNITDEVSLYTSFENQDLSRLSDVLKKAKPLEVDKKIEKQKKVIEI